MNAHFSAVTADTTQRKPPTSLFWKGKGFTLAGTRDAVETLSRDKTKPMPAEMQGKVY